jgi:hypothetical protein
MPKTIKTRSGRVLQLPTTQEDAIITAAATPDLFVPARPANRKAGHLHPPAGASFEGRLEGVRKWSNINSIEVRPRP